MTAIWCILASDGFSSVFFVAPFGTIGSGNSASRHCCHIPTIGPTQTLALLLFHGSAWEEKKWRCAINWLMWVFRTCLICVQTQFERAMRLGTNFSVISLENCPGVACAFNRPDEPRDSNHGGSHSFLSVLFHRRLDSVVGRVQRIYPLVI